MNWLKVLAPVGVILVGIAATYGVVATAPKEKSSEQVDTRPLVMVDRLSPQSHTVTLTSYGEVTPLESTQLAAQVAGEVTQWSEGFIHGGLVRRGDTLFTIEKDAYETALLQAEADLSAAQAQLIQEKAQARVAEQEARLMPDTQVTELYLRKPQLLSAQASVKSAEAMLKIAQRDLENCEVKAPYDALVVSREIGVGDYVSPGTLAATIHNIETAEVTFPVAGFDRHLLPENLSRLAVKVSTDARQSSVIDGYIHRDSGVVDAATRLSHLVLRIDDPYGIDGNEQQVKFGSYVNISFKGRTLQDVYRIPQELVTNNRIWLMDSDNKLVPRDVEVVHESGKHFFIRADLADANVVMTLPEYPQPGMEVKVAQDSDDLVAQKQ
ncbi:efflux RND transporter periplasmic adaptor subunit [Salinimonas iocasae]|uniref:Efflux RND transporter periplasmic adaptor subunit n=1 Tax=Salinimonas iocasae TaxID=2572577 RepID=A0A5B7YHU4_9ALTE|nr:efflux RND transporter periplasmic adaptor subunit [Salinimonas iocasae]QCZ94049.1 efflux RND transporter periplasmic adaptor subunit [Salinimonas iocasae]